MARAMSNSVTNVEIEDVLSSIRRLVSEEARPRKEPDRPGADRLVLSPALRVAEPETPEQDKPTPPVNEGAVPIILTQPTVVPQASEISDDPGAEQSGLPLSEQSLVPESGAQETLTMPFDADVQSAEQDGLPLTDTVEAEAGIGIAELPDDPAPEDIAEAEQIAALRASLSGILGPQELLTDDPDSDDWGEASDVDVLTDPDVDDGGDANDDAHDAMFATKIATLEHMLQKQSEGWAPAPEAAEVHEASGDGPDALTSAAEMVDQLVVAESERESPNEVVSHQEQMGPVSEDSIEPTSDVPTLEAEAQAVVPPIPDTDALDEPVVVADPPFRHHAKVAVLDWEDDTPEQRPEVATTSEPAEKGQGDALAELDEEALRELVAEIVRQELQGVLGERITRNVRKLVRREIHRVLMSQDFD